MKLIIINGPSGIGKSTVALKVAETMDAVLIDIDELRRSIPNYREDKKNSLNLAYQETTKKIEECLNSGKSVVIDKTITNEDVINLFIETGKKFKAQIFEFILFADKNITKDRADKRGYRPDSLLDASRVEEIWEKINLLRLQRPQAIIINTDTKEIEEVFQEIISILSK